MARNPAPGRNPRAMAKSMNSSPADSPVRTKLAVKAEDYAIRSLNEYERSSLTTDLGHSKREKISKSKVHSIFTKVQAGLFQEGILPYIENPKDILVLKCVNKKHFEVLKKRSGDILKHYERAQGKRKSIIGNTNI